MNIIDFIVGLFIDSTGREAGTENRATASILLRVAFLLIIIFCGLLWLYYHFI
jgi:biotin transporter BioY